MVAPPGSSEREVRQFNLHRIEQTATDTLGRMNGILIPPRPNTDDISDNLHFMEGIAFPYGTEPKDPDKPHMANWKFSRRKVLAGYFTVWSRHIISVTRRCQKYDQRRASAVEQGLTSTTGWHSIAE